MNPWLILDGFGGDQCVAVRPILVRIFNAPAAVWISQALFYQKHFADADADGWWEVRQTKIELETGLSTESQKSARVQLKKLGLLEEKPWRGNQLQYRLKLEQLVEVIITGKKISGYKTKNEIQNQDNPETEEKTITDENQDNPESGTSGNQNQDNPESGRTGFQNQDFTGFQNQDNPETSKEKDPSLRPFFKTPTSARENSENLNAKQTPDEEEVQKIFEPQTPNQTPNLELQNPDETNQIGVRNGETPRGFENVPPAASETDRARNALTALLSTNPVHKPQLDKIEFWLEHHHPRFILALVSAVMTGEGVQKSGFGMLFTALNTVGNKNVPAKLQKLHARLKANLTDTLEFESGAYTDEHGKVYQVSSWSSGFDALLAGGTHRIPERGTWLWMRTPEHDLKPLPTLEQQDTACEDLEQYHPVLNAMRLRVTHHEFDTWLKKLVIVESPEFQIFAPNQFVKKWLEEHYKADFVLVTGLEHLSFGVKQTEVTV